MLGHGDRARSPGKVSTTPDRPPARERYDVAVLGAGVLGAACAALLRRWAPEQSLVLIEADGIPNEAAASVASPGLMPPPPQDPAAAAEVRWARALMAEALPRRPEPNAGWLRLLPDGRPPPQGARPFRGLLANPLAQALERAAGIVPERLALPADGGYLPPDALALALARQAVESGADLMLNTRARPEGVGGEGWRLRLERLALDRRMTLGVRARQRIHAGALVVACGASGGEVAEAALDRPVSLPVAYRQYPRLRLPSLPGAAGPVIELAGWRLRPSAAGAVLVPPPLPPDPAGYRPVEGRLTGVAVGLRRELIERLLDEPALRALLASGALELGKSVRSVRGAWVSAAPDGPVAQPLGRGGWLLAGSEAGLDRDLGAAGRVAVAVARQRGVVDVPWPPPHG